jgi:hypothetical protein
MILALLTLAAALGGAPAQARGSQPAPNPAPVRCPDVVYRIATAKTDNCPPVVLMRDDSRKPAQMRDA